MRGSAILGVFGERKGSLSAKKSSSVFSQSTQKKLCMVTQTSHHTSPSSLWVRTHPFALTHLLRARVSEPIRSCSCDDPLTGGLIQSFHWRLQPGAALIHDPIPPPCCQLPTGIMGINLLNISIHSPCPSLFLYSWVAFKTLHHFWQLSIYGWTLDLTCFIFTSPVGFLAE